MDLGLKDKVVIATGGSKGIGSGAVVNILAQGQAKVPLRRYASPEDVANLTLFLASAKANYITGAIVPMDGGSSPVL